MKYLHQKSKIKAMVFDLDYSLHDEGDYLYSVFLNSGLDGLGKLRRSDISYQIRMQSKDIIKDILSKVGIYTRVNHDFIFDSMKLANQKLHCYQGVLDILKRNRDRGMKIALLTNGVPEIQLNKINNLGVSEYFDNIIYAKSTGVEKPGLLPFTNMLSALELNPNEIVFIGDHPVNDILPAKKIGMKTIWIDHGFFATAQSDYRVNIPNRVEEILDKL